MPMFASRLTQYIIFNVIFLVSIYFGFFENVEGAKNLALFIAWVTSLMGTLILLAFLIESSDKTSNFSKSLCRHPEHVVPYPIDLILDLIAVGVFIWFNHFILGIFYFLHMIAVKQVRDTPKNIMLKKLKGTNN